MSYKYKRATYGKLTRQLWEIENRETRQLWEETRHLWEMLIRDNGAL